MTKNQHLSSTPFKKLCKDLFILLYKKEKNSTIKEFFVSGIVLMFTRMILLTKCPSTLFCRIWILVLGLIITIASLLFFDGAGIFLWEQVPQKNSTFTKFFEVGFQKNYFIQFLRKHSTYFLSDFIICSNNQSSKKYNISIGRSWSPAL